MCFAPQRRAPFRHLNCQKCPRTRTAFNVLISNLLRATTAWNFSSLIWPDGSAPAALASLLFDSPEPKKIRKTESFGTFPFFRVPWSSSFFLFSDPSHFCFLHVSILSEFWLLNFRRLCIASLNVYLYISVCVCVCACRFAHFTHSRGRGIF